jgi:hemolysin III
MVGLSQGTIAMSLPAAHPRLAKRALARDEVLADAVVHVLGLCFGLIAFSGLLGHVVAMGDGRLLAAMSAYAAGFFLMFGFSLAYNMADNSPQKWVLRRFDHSAIFVMIAGTYTALLVHFDSAVWAWSLALTVWIGAAGGIILKMGFPGRHDGLAIVFYVVLGAVGLVGIGPARDALPGVTITLIVAGGLVYVAGIGFYKWNALRFHNAIWHGFVLLAAGLQFAGIAVAVAA